MFLRALRGFNGHAVRTARVREEKVTGMERGGDAVVVGGELLIEREHQHGERKGLFGTPTLRGHLKDNAEKDEGAGISPGAIKAKRCYYLLVWGLRTFKR